MAALWTEWKRQFLSFNRNIQLFLSLLFVWNVGLGMFGLCYNLYVKALGYSQTTIGDIVGMTALASAIIIVPAGILNDRIGPKKVISTGIILVIGSFIARSLLVSEGGMLMSAFVGGLALGRKIAQRTI